MTEVYAQLLRPRAHRSFVLSAAIGRLPMAILGLATVTTMTATTGSYAVAGAISATMLLTQSACAPLLGRLADKVGQARLLRPVATVHALALLAVALTATLREPLWLIATCAAVAGGSFPPLGPLVRQRWSHRLDEPDHVVAAFSLESALDEVIYVLGPLVVVAIGLFAAPAWGLVACSVLTYVGSLAFLRCRSTEPPPRTTAPTRVRVTASPISGLLTIAAAVGVFVGATEVSMIGTADDHDRPWAAGLLISLFSIGSVLAGLTYGARPPRLRAQDQLLVSGCGLVLAGVALVSVPGLWGYVPAVLLAGCLFAPSIIVAYDLLARSIDDTALTEGFAWMQAALGLGLGIGTASAGVLVGDFGGRAGFVVAVVAGVLATISAARLQRRRTGATLAR